LEKYAGQVKVIMQKLPTFPLNHNYSTLQKIPKYLYIMDGDTIHMDNKCIICKCELKKDIHIICEECYERYFTKLALFAFYNKMGISYAAD